MKCFKMGTSYALKETIVKINRIFHDFESEYYDKRHQLMIYESTEMWIEMLDTIKAWIPEKAVVLDIGCGTGFVPLMLLSRLPTLQRIVCNDLSSKMLWKCREKLENSAPKDVEILYDCRDMYQLDYRNSFDLVTMNSTLHHLPDPRNALMLVDKMVKPGGFVIIAHEPNLSFLRNNALRIMAFLVRKYKSLKNILVSMLEKTGQECDDWIYDRTNEELIKQGLVRTPLKKRDIQRLVDWYSPTAAGGFDSKHCIDFEEVRDVLRNYQCVYFRTKSHLGKTTLLQKDLVITKIDKLLRNKFPVDGLIAYAVFRKEG